MGGFFKASAALGDTASGRQAARNKQKKLLRIFLENCAALLKGEVVIFCLSLKM